MRIFGAAAAVFALTLSAAACGSRSRAPRRPGLSAGCRPSHGRHSAARDATEYVATLKSLNSTTIQPQIDGQITQILVKSGDRVKAGRAAHADRSAAPGGGGLEPGGEPEAGTPTSPTPANSSSAQASCSPPGRSASRSSSRRRPRCGRRRPISRRSRRRCSSSRSSCATTRSGRRPPASSATCRCASACRCRRRRCSRRSIRTRASRSTCRCRSSAPGR